MGLASVLRRATRLPPSRRARLGFLTGIAIGVLYCVWAALAHAPAAPLDGPHLSRIFAILLVGWAALGTLFGYGLPWASTPFGSIVMGGLTMALASIGFTLSLGISGFEIGTLVAIVGVLAGGLAGRRWLYVGHLYRGPAHTHLVR